MDKRNLLYCALYLAGEPVKRSDLMTTLEVSYDEFTEMLNDLNSSLSEHSPLMVSNYGELIALETRPEFSEFAHLFTNRKARKAKITKEATETLAIIAYRQPITRKEIEHIRSCDCDRTISSLLSWRLISTIGRADEPGSPILYKTTDLFLHHFGLQSISDLPEITRSTDMTDLHINSKKIF